MKHGHRAIAWQQCFRAGGAFNYIALATLFASSIPLNGKRDLAPTCGDLLLNLRAGLLLQNAITTYPSTYTNKTTLHVGMYPNLPVGFSAKLYSDIVSPYSDTFRIAIGIIGDNSGLSVGHTYYNPIGYENAGGCGDDDLSGVCTSNVQLHE